MDNSIDIPDDINPLQAGTLFKAAQRPASRDTPSAVLHKAAKDYAAAEAREMKAAAALNAAQAEVERLRFELEMAEGALATATRDFEEKESAADAAHEALSAAARQLP